MNVQLKTQAKEHATSSFMPVSSSLFRRKCACGNHTMAGGECEECSKQKRWGLQTKLKVNEPGDSYEQEAERVADRMMATPQHHAINGMPPRIQRFAGQSAGQVDATPASVDHALAGPGRPLEPALRQDMEQRFGRDFGAVRVYTGSAAAESARSLSARAYTVGRDVVFAGGEYSPGTCAGRHLLAHELTHVEQQAQPGGPARIQRMTLGAGAPPATGNWPAMAPGPVPAAEQPLVNEAIAMLAEVAQDPDTYDDCHDLFADNCPGGGAASLQTAFNNAILWRLNPANRPTLRGFGSVNGTNIGYTAYVYDMGARELAMTLVHELMHNCGITGPAQHYVANVAKLYCIGPRNRLSFAIGMTGTDLPAGFLVYRRILTEWAGGHLNLTAGGDINVVGLIAATSAAVTDAEPTPAEWGSASIGLQGRTALLWGGDRFGGLRASVDLGVGVGQFALRTPGPEEGPTVAPSLILQVGAGAEFYLPVGTKAKPVSVDVALRLAQPRNSEAQRIQTYSISVGTHF